MRHFAFLTMCLAWLLYGAAAALATCPMCGSLTAARPSHEAAASQVTSMTADMAMSGIAMSDMAMPGEMTAAPRPQDGTPCGLTHMPFCAACMILPPDLVTHGGSHVPPAYPSPGAAQPLRDARATPIPPPPRFV